MRKYPLIVIALAITSVSGIILADAEHNLGTCSYPDTLHHGVNMTSYQQCVAQFSRCPKNGPYLDGTCVKKNVTQEPRCKQLNQLAQQLNASAQLIDLQQQAGFTIIDVAFPADGAHQYSLLSPNGCLIDTLVDPRDLNPEIKKQYANKDFYLEAENKPTYTKQFNGTQQFTINIQAKNQCRACEVIGTAKIAFTFSTNGKWTKTALLSFEKT